LLEKDGKEEVQKAVIQVNGNSFALSLFAARLSV